MARNQPPKFIVLEAQTTVTLRLDWVAVPDGVVFSVGKGGAPATPLHWSTLNLELPSGARAHVGPLIRLLQSGGARAGDDDGSVWLAQEAVAALTGGELRGLGLPGLTELHLEVESQGIPTDPSYQVRYRFLEPESGRYVASTRRTGPILDAGGIESVLPIEMLRLIRAAETLSGGESRSREEQLEAIASFREALPSSVRQGPHFSSIRLVRAGRMSIRPFVNAKGEADFDPVLLRESRIPEPAAEDLPPQLLLPEAVHDSWTRLFRRRSKVHRVEPAGDGWIVVGSESFQKVLAAVRDQQKAPEPARREFLAAPHAKLKALLAGQVEEQAIDEFLADLEGFSDRVREVGLWRPKVLPYLKAQGRDWLPPEQVGLRVGDEELSLSAGEAGKLRRTIEKALSSGQDSVDVRGVKLPVSEETVAALRELESVSERSVRSIKESRARGATVLLILGNLDLLEFEDRQRPVPASLRDLESRVRTRMLPHQEAGVSWLSDCWEAGVSGALLADDMGLGKTLQVLAFLSWLRGEVKPQGRKPAPILVVAPTGLLSNWLAEHDTHLADEGLGRPLVAQGRDLQRLRVPASARKKELEAGLPSLKVEVLQSADWVLTTYETLRDYQHSFGRVRWLAVVLDEAQRAKNPEAQVTSAVKAMNASFWIAVTGTPVENRLSDLWCIVDAVRPGLLGSLRDFCSKYEEEGDGTRTELEALRQKLMEAPPAVLMRRYKADHLAGLPDLEVHRVHQPMPERQAREYSAVAEQARGSRDRGAILAALHQLRAVSLHPMGSIGADDDEFISSSARWRYAFTILEEIRRLRQKAVIFLDSLAHQSFLAEIAHRKFELNQAPVVISGEVAGESRKRLVDSFQQRAGFDVLIMSPRAGGVGLTVTAANHVIHLSRWWNPAVEDQCTDRVYRIGQTRPVHVYVPMAIHPTFGLSSFDVKLDKLLSEKRALSRALLAPPTISETELGRLFAETVGSGADRGS